MRQVAPIEACRACGHRDLASVLDLGPMPLANAFLTEEQLQAPEPRVPLELAVCPGCSLAQITQTVPPEELFRDYAYFSSYSDTMISHADRLAQRTIIERRLGPSSLVIEAASNDGYLLQSYARANVPVLGVEPAANVARVAEERGIPTLCEFFGRDVAHKLRQQGRRADVFHAHNVLAHVADLHGFVEGVKDVLADRGVAILEVPYVRELVERLEFDTIYHEHLCYFSLSSLTHLFAHHGLALVDVERVPIHGGSLRLFVAAKEHAAPPAPSVAALLAEEAGAGFDRPDAFVHFARRVRELERELVAVLRALKADGQSIAAYGAAAKGSTLLNAFGIGRDLVDYVVDRSPHKQGRYVPGVHLPIHAPERLLSDAPGYVLLLAWNFETEILEQQRPYRETGGRFVVPLPQVRVI